MKLYFLFILLDLLVLLVYPLAYVLHRYQKLIGAKSNRRRG